MKKSLTILMALTLLAGLSACNPSPLAVGDDVDAGDTSAAKKEPKNGPILPPDPEIGLPPHPLDPGDGAGGGDGRGGGGDVVPRQDL